MEIRGTITPSPPGGILGTVDYMSPEQLLGQEVDHRSDIFSFGVVLYQMITGRLPFPGSTITETIDSILNENPLPVERHNDKAPEALSRVIGKMLQKELEDRYQSVREVWIDLSQIKTEPAHRVFSPQMHRKYSSWTIRGLILMAALLAVYLYWPRPPLSKLLGSVRRSGPIPGPSFLLPASLRIRKQSLHFTGGDITQIDLTDYGTFRISKNRDPHLFARSNSIQSSLMLPLKSPFYTRIAVTWHPGK